MATEWLCEAGVGIDETGPGILIIKCGKPAELRKNLMLFEVALCDECYAKILAKRMEEVRDDA